MNEGTTFSSPRFVMAVIQGSLEIESMDGGSQDSAEGPKLQLPLLVSNMKLPSYVY